VVRLTSLSFAYPAVPSDRRAELSLPGTVLHQAHRRLRSTGLQAFLLSTCLRVEMALAAGPEASSDLMACLYGDRSLADLGTVRTGEDAFVHLCRVAAGLDSPLVGEPEVLGQFRHAVSTYHQATAASGSLGRVLEATIGIGRTTRKLLGEAPRGSLASLAASAAALFPRVAILGAGAMARAAAEHLDDVDLAIFARRPGQVGGRETLNWEEALEALAIYPVVISTVPGKAPLFTEKTLASVFARRNQPLLLIDLGMPPGFARPPADDTIRYLGVDELASSMNARPLAEAEKSVALGAAASWRRLSAPDRAGRVIAAVVEQAETAVDEEVRRFANRLSTADDPERVMRHLAHTVARRVLHSPISFIGSTDADAVEILAEAFGIGDE
jgi:glutamyl-tRNA reductase